MDNILKNSIENLIIRAAKIKASGVLVQKDKINEINLKLNSVIPDWFIEIVSSYPLCGLSLDFPFDNSEDNDYILSIQIATPQDIFNETEECYPGFAIKVLGYFCIGTDLTGSGDPYFISNKEGDNPPVYLIQVASY